MFEKCETLSELNRERQQLVRRGYSILEINRAYNVAKKRLMNASPSYRIIPSYKLETHEVETYSPFPILPGHGKPNEIVITSKGVLM